MFKLTFFVWNYFLAIDFVITIKPWLFTILWSFSLLWLSCYFIPHNHQQQFPTGRMPPPRKEGFGFSRTKKEASVLVDQNLLSTMQRWLDADDSYVCLKISFPFRSDVILHNLLSCLLWQMLDSRSVVTLSILTTTHMEKNIFVFLIWFNEPTENHPNNDNETLFRSLFNGSKLL